MKKVTRVDVLKAWTSRENQRHWGANKTPYRNSEGGDEEYGSIGFSQIQFRYLYGNTNGCALTKGKNFYSVRDNLMGFGVWSADFSCGGSFYYAFNGKYDHGFNGDGQLVGILMPNGSITPLNDVASNVTDDYERLLKAIAGYKGGAYANYLRNCSLPELMQAAEKTACASAPGSFRDYAIRTLHNKSPNGLNLPYRTFVWKVGGDVDGFCFGFGVEEWLNGIKWMDLKSDIENGIESSIDCPLQ